ncbi:MAG: FAD-dependent oxidoreductase [Candidatus Hodarchaeota archaeon]
MFRKVSLDYDVVVVGGGVAGTVAAISAARSGSKTVLVQNRSVLGGNGSSEVRVHIGGASHSGYRYDARESGILEEIRLETAVRDPYNTYSWIDTVLYSYCEKEPDLDVLFNTHVSEVKKNGSKITSVVGINNGDETTYEISGKVFIDGTGHGTVGYLAGAEFRMGREARSEFNESVAPVEADGKTLGASILFRAEDVGRPVDFTPPSWAIDYSKERPPRHVPGKSGDHDRYWHGDTSGWWWVEWGGSIDRIHDNEAIRKRLQSLVYGLWDFIKNHHYNQKTREEARNFAITWIGSVPGHRESRRLLGDYLLNQNDLEACKIFDDQIAVGGWSIDLHPPEGFWDSEPSCTHTLMDMEYSIPFRSIYSKDVLNLFMASRCVSATHAAHGSTRLIATLAVIGQAAGAAAHMCIVNDYSPRDLLNKDIKKLQQLLLKEDQWLLGISNEDPDDLARHAKISSNSEYPCFFDVVEKWIPLYFPIAQRFHVPSHDKGNESPEVSFYLRNTSNQEQEVTGGLRRDPTRFPFKGEEDLATFSVKVTPNSEGWFTVSMREGDLDFSAGGEYWLYLNGLDEDGVEWGMQCFQWPGTLMGFYNEDEEKWYLHRKSGYGFYGAHIGSRGTFCFKIVNVPSPFPAGAMNNGKHRPFYNPNLWISAPFKQPYKTPNLLSVSERRDQYPVDVLHDKIEVYVDFKDDTEFSELWFTFDTDLDNPYPHQNYGDMKIKDWPILGKAPNCISEMDIFLEKEAGGSRELIGSVKDNYQRRVKVKLDKPVKGKRAILVPKKNWGFHCYGLYELRIY